MMADSPKKTGDSPNPWDTEKAIRARWRMVKDQILSRGIHDPRVIEAMRAVPRHIFVPKEEADWAYMDGPLPLGFGQTISQPYMVALMTEVLNLRGTEKVLEIGTGSGYQAAILCRLAVWVYSIERVKELADRARKSLDQLGIDNVKVLYGNGSLGLREEGPFDAIIVTAAAPDVPDPLLEQLAEGGILVLPVGERETQTLIRITKSGATYHRETLGMCAFVPLIGSEGWKDNSI